jgi:hypothetical protein
VVRTHPEIKDNAAHGVEAVLGGNVFQVIEASLRQLQVPGGKRGGEPPARALENLAVPIDAEQLPGRGQVLEESAGMAAAVDGRVDATVPGTQP